MKEDRLLTLSSDIDNCLYPKSESCPLSAKNRKASRNTTQNGSLTNPGAKVHDRMAHLIDEYFVNHLSLPWEEAVRLHKEYYQSYGLALEGLVRHHQIDPLEYNAKVDDALPLEGVIVPNPTLKQLLRDIDRSKARVWLFTNAYATHGKRVVRLLEVEDQFDGITFCDYAKVPFVCKPHRNMFEKAMREAGVSKAEDCFFVGESPQRNPLQNRKPKQQSTC